MEKRISELDDLKLKYFNSIFDKALRQAKIELEEEFVGIEYEINFSDSERVVVTVSNRKIGEYNESGLIIPKIDANSYSVSIENLRIDQNVLRGDIGCFTWSGPLVVTKSPTEFYMADVKSTEINKPFEAKLTFKTSADVDELTKKIIDIIEECVAKVT